MISKELLSEALGFSIGNCWNDGILIVWKEDGMSEINIYELAHKCKKWAFNNYEIMLESTIIFSSSSRCKGIDEVGFCVMVTYAETEPEAIFKACQWILENKENK